MLLIASNFILERRYSNQPVIFGVSYAPFYAEEIGLDPKITYQQILTQLNVKNIRLNAYWNEIEPIQGIYDFNELDWYINEAQKNQANIILTVGFKLPRWPECRKPEWLSEDNRQEHQLIMVQKVIERYNQSPTIKAFQIENEPYLNFGICPGVDGKFFDREMKMVRGITQKPILVTDSGELQSWVKPMQQSDIFGTTLYRKVTDQYFGEIFYPLPPSFYKVKSDLARGIFAKNNQETIVAELQAELWAGKPLTEIPLDEQLKKFPLTQFQSTINYSKRTGFQSFYLWGVEWWYYLASHGHPEYLEYAKTLF